MGQPAAMLHHSITGGMAIASFAIELLLNDVSEQNWCHVTAMCSLSPQVKLVWRCVCILGRAEFDVHGSSTALVAVLCRVLLPAVDRDFCATPSMEKIPIGVLLRREVL